MADLANVARCAGWRRIAAGRCRGGGCTRVAWGVGFVPGSRRAGRARFHEGGDSRVPDKRLHAWRGKLKGCHDEKQQDE